MFWKMLVAIILTIVAAVTTHNALLTIATFLVTMIIVFVIEGVRVVPQQNAWVVERLGKFHAILRAGPQLHRAVHRPRRLPALAQGSAARRARAGLHHQGQHPALRGRDHLLPGHRPAAGELRHVELRVRHHAARADHAAQRSRQDGTRQDLREPRRNEQAGRVGARRSRPHLGREGAALRNQEPDAAGSDPALDAGADHRGAREARADRQVRRPAPAGDQSRRRREAGQDPFTPKATRPRRSTRRRAKPARSR